ncbi:phage holin family protein [Actinopolyspora erythraea]|uniref:Membrane protein n=1 Tax=Actinopolyspora erythraea TaxID=414996 RepID=A0A099D4R1_9ACTN|nr:phage holin family protein [Actinopolyspora erythraea]ASU79454.1 phage holin family protein [Actinopolyspora erythraea]KGI80921.1 membrane protein [Actinopolyspora erythraea]
MALVVHILITAVAVWLTTALPGITLGDQGPGTEGAAAQALTLLVVAVVFGVVNAVLKPVAKTLGCLLYVITLGLFGLVVNALLFWLTGWIASRLELPFHVDGFWAAFWGAIIVTVVSSVLHGIVRRVTSIGD